MRILGIIGLLIAAGAIYLGFSYVNHTQQMRSALEAEVQSERLLQRYGFESFDEWEESAPLIGWVLLAFGVTGLTIGAGLLAALRPAATAWTVYLGAFGIWTLYWATHGLSAMSASREIWYEIGTLVGLALVSWWVLFRRRRPTDGAA